MIFCKLCIFVCLCCCVCPAHRHFSPFFECDSARVIARTLQLHTFRVPGPIWPPGGGCCDQHSLPKLWAMVPGPRHAKGKAIELGERVALVFLAEIKVLLIESGGLGGKP